MRETPRTWKRRSAARPVELRAAALRRFSERGFSGATIEDVAEAAGVTVGTVYRYFTDKRALLGALIDWAATVPLVDPETPPAPSGADALRRTLRAIWSASRGEPHAGVLRILVAEGAGAPELVTRYRQAVLDPAAAALADCVRQSVEPEQAELAARALLGQLLGASVLAGVPPTIEALIPQVDPLEVTVEMLVARMGEARPRASSADPPAPRPSTDPPVTARRFSGPESW